MLKLFNNGEQRKRKGGVLDEIRFSLREGEGFIGPIGFLKILLLLISLEEGGWKEGGERSYMSIPDNSKSWNKIAILINLFVESWKLYRSTVKIN